MRIIAWRTASGSLATNLAENQRHIPASSTCPICGIERESSFHALITCVHARHVWEALCMIWPLPDDSILVDTGKDWLLQVLSNCPDHIRDRVIMTIWRIWQLRNDIAHGKMETPVEVTVQYLDSYYKSLNLVSKYSMEEIIKGKMAMCDDSRVYQVKTNLLPKLWPPPQSGWVALSIDGSFSSMDGRAAAGMVLRREDGSLIFAAYRYIFHCNDALEAENMRLCKGWHWPFSIRIFWWWYNQILLMLYAFLQVTPCPG